MAYSHNQTIADKIGYLTEGLNEYTYQYNQQPDIASLSKSLYIWNAYQHHVNSVITSIIELLISYLHVNRCLVHPIRLHQLAIECTDTFDQTELNQLLKDFNTEVLSYNTNTPTTP